MEDNAMVVCTRNNIKVYPIIYDLNHLKIEVDYGGRKKQGEEIYNWKKKKNQKKKKLMKI